ncbi:MAG: ATP-binding protein [Pseudomonadota bacterium]
MPQKRLAQMIALSDLMEIPVLILEVRDDGSLAFRKLNKFHERTSGMSSAVIEGRTPHEIFPRRMAHSLTQKYMTCVQTRAPFSYQEVLKLPAGEMWWRTMLSPIIFDDGRVIGIFAVSVDITDQKDREISDAKRIAVLTERNEELNTHMSMAAHDVRGPLRKIRVVTELVLAEGDRPTSPASKKGTDDGFFIDAQQAALIGSVGEIASKSLSHVDSILSYARAQSLDEDGDLDVVNLSLLFADLVSILDSNSETDIAYPTLSVEADRTILQIVLRNLMENAVKFGKSACHVAVDAAAKEPDHLVFTISDDGDGFGDTSTVEDLSQVARERAGTGGFGLAGAHRLVKARGGSMWLTQSYFETGGGVAFTIRGRLVDASGGANQ